MLNSYCRLCAEIQCFQQVITIYDYHEKVLRAQQTLYSILAECETDLDIKLEPIGHEFTDEKVSITDLDNKSTIDTTNFGHSIFDNDNTPDIKSGNEDDSEDDIPLNERKLRDQQTESSVDKNFVDETKCDPEKTANACIRKLSEILKEWKTYKKWFCIKCDNKIEVGTIKDLKNHWFDVHKAPPKYQCIVCDKVYEKFEIFRKHINAHRDKYKYKCDICGKYSHKRDHHDNHIETHLKVRKYMCSTCGKSFKTHGGLYSHSRMHLPDELRKKFRCEMCDKSFNSSSNLTLHRKMHAGIKEYTCDQCGKMFSTKNSLNQHCTNVHSDETPFHCPLCPKAFKLIYGLKSHQTVHTNIKPFKCDTCGKTFREKARMKAHQKIHTTELPFKCEYCKKCFKLKYVLKVHLRQHTGERPYSCQECNHQFTNWSNYNKHMKGRHGINVKSKATQILQQQRLQLMKQEELIQMQQEQEQQQMSNESSDNNHHTLNNINNTILPIPQQLFHSDL
ncbi:zinc finger protein 616-like [Chrysoperla carnea]|uniref:zinc finger protein 616-like n=1 Tax=Chrysoperla carnea TaxID=189513 RepID=UPI001D07560A|nr:zinc finger protein 616-like [Chrysoperla carnea]